MRRRVGGGSGMTRAVCAATSAGPRVCGRGCARAARARTIQISASPQANARSPSIASGGGLSPWPARCTEQRLLATSPTPAAPSGHPRLAPRQPTGASATPLVKDGFTRFGRALMRMLRAREELVAKGHRPSGKAIGAIRHDLLVAYFPHRPRPSPTPRSRTRLAAQALLRRAPRPTPAAPTRSARLRRHC